MSLDFNSWYSITLSRSIGSREEQEEDVEEVEDDAAPNVDIEERGREESIGSSRETGAMSVS